MNKTFVEYLKTDNISGKKSKENWLKNNRPDIYEDILNFTKKLEITFKERVYCYVNNITMLPVCLNCGKPVVFTHKNGGGYNKYCSNICANKSVIKKDLTKNNNLKKYGVKSTMELPINKLKSKQTKKQKYGDENYVNRDKIKQTKKEKYGNEGYINVDKIKQTKKRRYGDENYVNTDKIKQTKKEKYGDDKYNNRDKAYNTNIKLFGVKHATQNKDIKEKTKQTNLKKYGVVSYTKTSEFKNKISNSHFNLTKEKISDKLNLNIDDINVTNDSFIIKNYCVHHDEFEIDKKNFYNRFKLNIENICTKCNPISELSSIKENEIKEFIKSLNINYVFNDKSIINSGELDIYLPDHKLAIEFNGLYYHSNLFKEKDYHLNKTVECEKKGIQLLHIFEDEWIYKKEIVKSIIKSKLGLIQNKIYARKCEIKETDDNNLISDFLNKNHIQGYSKSKYKIGLFYNNELVSLMTFELSRNSISLKTNSYHLNRFCNKNNLIVVGSASKLLSFFIKKYSPNEIVSFADRRISNGNLYSKLGFDLIKINPPTYCVFDKHILIRKHRFVYNKKNLIKMGGNKSLSESKILEKMDLLKIYDSGTMKFVLSFS